jgi:DNA-binding MarR family transcriptional regulator
MKHPARKTIGFQLMLAARLHRTRVAAILNEIGLFPGQEQALQVLGMSDSITMGALARAMRVRPPTISKTITRLEAQDLVSRMVDQQDGRIVSVSLTTTGRAKLEHIETSLARMEAELLEDLDQKDAKRLFKLLRKVSRSLGEPTDLDTETLGDLDAGGDD